MDDVDDVGLEVVNVELDCAELIIQRCLSLLQGLQRFPGVLGSHPCIFRGVMPWRDGMRVVHTVLLHSGLRCWLRVP